MGEQAVAHRGVVAARLSSSVNLTDPIDEAIARVPERIAFIVGDSSVTYAELGDAIEHASAALIASGVGAGDRVALVDAAGTLAIATVLACARRKRPIRARRASINGPQRLTHNVAPPFGIVVLKLAIELVNPLHEVLLRRRRGMKVAILKSGHTDSSERSYEASTRQLCGC